MFLILLESEILSFGIKRLNWILTTMLEKFSHCTKKEVYCERCNMASITKNWFRVHQLFLVCSTLNLKVIQLRSEVLFFFFFFWFFFFFFFFFFSGFFFFVFCFFFFVFFLVFFFFSGFFFFCVFFKHF